MYWLSVMKCLLIANGKTCMEYKVNFIVYIFSAISSNLIILLFIWSVLSRFQSLQQWSFQEVFFLFSLRLVAHGLRVMCFSNVQRLSFYVRQGDFDRFLLRPLNPLFQILIWYYHPASIGDLGTGIVCLISASNLLDIHWTLLSLGYLLLIVIGGCLIEASLFIIVHVLAFWITDAQRIAPIVMMFNDYFSLYPLTIYNTFIKILLTFIIPVGFISYYPATAFLSRTNEIPFTPMFAYITPLVGLSLFTLTCMFWQVGQNHYQGTGS
ncbi:multidrug ABC transporter permease [Reticulibacter mediterranei]|uniref:Multidrug ABC transporter permease n=1 Tax=Reticulibacter mediterranei TaxID=2778369 RepID=A0A8J3INY9_9CHLR|nr:ABC-2 family transporter protein [Reticulibacter mediterranei]GHO97488.1 multidrug ABC transporter permease [Reticulibacter mediterranei]